MASGLFIENLYLIFLSFTDRLHTFSLILIETIGAELFRQFSNLISLRISFLQMFFQLQFDEFTFFVLLP